MQTRTQSTARAHRSLTTPTADCSTAWNAGATAAGEARSPRWTTPNGSRRGNVKGTSNPPLTSSPPFQALKLPNWEGSVAMSRMSRVKGGLSGSRTVGFVFSLEPDTPPITLDIRDMKTEMPIVDRRDGVSTVRMSRVAVFTLDGVRHGGRRRGFHVQTAETNPPPLTWQTAAGLAASPYRAPTIRGSH